MNDIETKLKAMLNEQVDAEVGRRRTPPPFQLPSAAEHATRRWFGRDRAPWMLPLLAAACVATVVGGSLGASSLLANDKKVAPGTSAPAPSPSVATTPPAPSSTPTAVATTPTSSTTAPQNTHTQSSEPPKLHYRTVELGGATIAVPDGWTVGNPFHDSTGSSWCLNPSGADPADSGYGCAINLETVIPTGQPYTWIDVDYDGFGKGDPPQYCIPQRPTVVEQTGDRTFGGRTAEWRLFERTCPDGQAFESEQYIVAYNPSFAMFAGLLTPRIDAAMTEIAEYSTLPSQTDPVRLMDRGIIRSADRGSDGVTITLDRVVNVMNHNGAWVDYVNNNPTTYTYVIPTSIFDAANVSVGDRIVLETDGVRVLKLSTGGR